MLKPYFMSKYITKIYIYYVKLHVTVPIIANYYTFHNFLICHGYKAREIARCAVDYGISALDIYSCKLHINVESVIAVFVFVNQAIHNKLDIDIML